MKPGETGSFRPPDKGDKRGFLPYRQSLTFLARENHRNPTGAEKRIWFEILSGRKLLGLKFLRQKPVVDFILDFYCAELRFAIEIDGDTHAEQENYDKKRTKRLNSEGIMLTRYTNSEVTGNLEGVHSDLEEKIKLRMAELEKTGEYPVNRKKT